MIFLIKFLWHFHDFFWYSHDFLTTFSWPLKTFLWLSCAFLMTFSWLFQFFSMTFSWFSHDTLVTHYNLYISGLWSIGTCLFRNCLVFVFTLKILFRWTKKMATDSKLIEYFACCDAAFFLLQRFSIIKNIGSYDSLLLHCGGGGVIKYSGGDFSTALMCAPCVCNWKVHSDLQVGPHCVWTPTTRVLRPLHPCWSSEAGEDYLMYTVHVQCTLCTVY